MFPAADMTRQGVRGVSALRTQAKPDLEKCITCLPDRSIARMLHRNVHFDARGAKLLDSTWLFVCITQS